MAVISTGLRVNKSGGNANEDQNLSLGGDNSTAAGRLFVNNFLHNMYDEVEIGEATSGDTEYRHFYFINAHAFELKNCKLQILSNTQEQYSKVFFAKGTAANGFIEQAVVDENTGPVGISADAWKISGEIPLGNVASTSTCSIWTKRVVNPGSLIADLQKASFRILGDPPAGSGTPTCPTGQHYDTATSQCVNDVTTCPEGQILIDGECVPVQCQAGYHLEGGFCVPDTGGGSGGGGGGGSNPLPEPIFVAAVGDIGCNSDGDSTVGFVGAQPDLNLFIANGDLTYTSSPQCLVDNLNTANIKDITKISIGNHDDTEDGSASYRTAALSAFGLASGGYQSFQIQNVFFVGMDTQRDYSASSPQFTFVQNALQTAAASATVDWIVVFYHKPSMTAPSNHSPLTDFRNIYHPLFDTHKVDLILNGHNHNMQRTFPVKHNSASPSSPTIMSTATGTTTSPYLNIDGRIFVCSGAGGDGHYSVGSQPSHYAFTEDNTFGVFFFNTGNTATLRTMICDFVSSEGSGTSAEVFHRFQLAKSV